MTVTEHPHPDAEARDRGFCCSEHEAYGMCSHLREFERQCVAENAAEEAQRVAEEAESIAKLGAAGIREGAALGDPWCEEMLVRLGLPLAPVAAPPDSGPLTPSQVPGAADPPDGAPGPELLTGPTDDGSGPLFSPEVDSRSSRGLGGITLSQLAALPPGPLLAAVLDSIDVDQIDSFATVEVIAAFKRQEAWAAGRAALAAGKLSAKNKAFLPPARAGSKVKDGTAQEIAMRLATSSLDAEKMITVGRGMANMFQDTADHLLDGRIDYRKASTIITTLESSPGPVAWFVEQEVLDKASRRTPRQLTNDISKALISVDPDEADRRHHRAKARRRVTHPDPQPDGMARIVAHLGAAESTHVDLVLDAFARTAQAAGDPRNLDQLRADALYASVMGAAHLGWAGTPPGHVCGCDAADAAREASSSGDPEASSGGHDRCNDIPDGGTDILPPLHMLVPAVPGMPFGTPKTGLVNLTVPLSVALPPDAKLADPRAEGSDGIPTEGRAAVPASDADAAGSGVSDMYDQPLAEVAEIEGYGPVPPSIARALAVGGTWRRILTEPDSGLVRDVGRSRYRPPAALVEYIRLRDRTCFRPGCSRPAWSCELEHTNPWSQGGVSADHNLGMACKRDHETKTGGRFRVAQPRPGIFEWLTPSGHAYRREVDGTITMLPTVPPSLLEVGPPTY